MRNTSLHVGLIAPPWVAVPPPEYGGTELVVDHLARGLTELGHDVVLFTTGDSTCPVPRRWTIPTALGTNGSLLDELGHVEKAYATLAGCDVIHDHTLLGPLWAVANHVPSALVTTAHGPFTPELGELYRSVASEVAVVAISEHQRSTAPSVPVRRVIHHGFDVGRVPMGKGDGGYVLFLGRMHPDKGVHRAIQVARAAGKRLLIAAKMWEPAERRYFTEQVEPLLGYDATFLGQVGGARKYELLGGAEALINPIRWPEPFGLVMIEALAAGTPVIAFSEGAAPEIVEHGRTGYIAADEADMAHLLERISTIDRTACRGAAERRFSTSRMVEDHVELYHDSLAGRCERTLRLSDVGRAAVATASA
jgi:glycosyltransferase involved in cell wall biosynthesis